jgi:hypothetical protein
MGPTMLVCKACSTRFERAVFCPSCGRKASEHAVEVGRAKPDVPPLPLADAGAEVDLELEESSVVEKPKRAEGPASAKEVRMPESVPARRRAREAASPPVQLDCGAVRGLVAEQPGLLEKGLGVYADEHGKPVGVDFPTPLGEIDLLARDKAGAFVVVMVPEPGDWAQLVSDVVQRIGWVRKHVAGGKEVRGVVVVDHLPEEVGYAAAGVSGTVSFKTFRIAVQFDDIEV